MCGVVGFLNFGGGGAAWEGILQDMASALAHRGPDKQRCWCDLSVGVALGHRRLAILDLSELGDQPMFSHGGRYVITFNGEIYNFHSLREDLGKRGVVFRGHSDTEVMLAAFEQWGIAETVKRLVGMFAFGVWDRQERALTLGRDRLGEKPLYYGWVGGTFLFASELKALRRHPDWHGELDPNAIAMQLRFSYVPTPYSIYKNIHKLPPGTLLTIREGMTGVLPAPQPYWSAAEVIQQGERDPLVCSDGEAVEQLDTLLREAVRGQMIADVPLGAFLSGGVDSSAIVALMQAQSSQPVRAFSIGFTEAAYDEAPYARAVAQYLGTAHTEHYVTPQETLAVIPRLPTLYDEPFSDSSQIPTFIVAGVARQQVTVSLSGDGGDELFHGYQRYFDAERVYPLLRGLPMIAQVGLKRLLYGGLGLLPTEADKFWRLAEMLPTASCQELYFKMMSHWQSPLEVVLGATCDPIRDRFFVQANADFGRMMSGVDLLNYLPDDILVKVDRAAMGVSLETRVPLLDHRVVEFCCRLPHVMKVREGKSKWLLRQVLYRYVPPKLIERPKKGFGVPLARWLRHELRDWAEALLDERRLRQEGLFNPHPIRQKWERHLARRQNHSDELWDVLMFQAWHEAQD